MNTFKKGFIIDKKAYNSLRTVCILLLICFLNILTFLPLFNILYSKQNISKEVK